MPRTEPRRRHIALMIDTSREFGRGVCRGVSEYFGDRTDVLLVPYERPVHGDFPKWLKPPFIAGVIAYVSDEGMARRLFSMGIPVVDIHGRFADPRVPVVEPDPDALVDAAVAFFLKSGFRKIAYCGSPGIFFSDTREGAFRRIARDSGWESFVFDDAANTDSRRETFERERARAGDEKRLARWVSTLPEGTGILACNDIRGQQLVNACHVAGVAVPDRVAILGVDDDAVICELCRPRLSSLRPDLRRIGMTAAAKMDAALASGTTEGGRTRVLPAGIAERGSTDALAGDDPLVVRAGRMLRARAVSGVTVKEICVELKCSRTALDLAFGKAFGRTIAAELNRLRLESVRRMLRETDAPLGKVAARHGFSTTSYFCRFFRRETGMTPGRYRAADGPR